MNARLAVVSVSVVLSAALAGLSHGADIAWHATSVDAVRKGQNSETRTKAVFTTGDRADVTGYGTNHPDVNGVRPISAMALIRFEDLSSIFLKTESSYDAGSHQSTGKGEFIGGTGRFLGITGKVDCVTKYSTHESWETDCSGSYSMPSK